jgi:hypothetical protein
MLGVIQEIDGLITGIIELLNSKIINRKPWRPALASFPT